MASTQPIRIQRKRKVGWKLPPDTIYVGRPTLWGNPFIADEVQMAVDAFRKRATSKESCISFEMGPGKLQFAKNSHPDSLDWAWRQWANDHLHELRGKNLACWCALDQPCHADVLLEIANQVAK